jgi:hypothetical protein
VAERAAAPSAKPVRRLVELFGTSSLAAYFFHQMLLFFRIAGFSFEAVWGASCSWPKYWLVTALLVAATAVLTAAMDRVYALFWESVSAILRSIERSGAARPSPQ